MGIYLRKTVNGGQVITYFTPDVFFPRSLTLRNLKNLLKKWKWLSVICFINNFDWIENSPCLRSRNFKILFLMYYKYRDWNNRFVGVRSVFYPTTARTHNLIIMRSKHTHTHNRSQLPWGEDLFSSPPPTGKRKKNKKSLPGMSKSAEILQGTE